MIRATTGRPAGMVQKKDKIVIRPSSANAKMQSRSYSTLGDEIRPATANVTRTSSVIPLQAVPVEAVAKPPSRPILDRRLTLCTVDGIGENAKVLTRLNTPASSMKKIKIEERITLEQLHKIKTAFEEADTDGSGTLDIDEFKTVVKTCLGVKGRNEEQIVALFMKIDSSSDGEIDWDEFCTYMQLEYAEKEEAILRSKRTGFALPAITSSSSTPHHKSPILRIICVSDSSYICAGQDGLLTFWSPDMKLRKTKSILESALAERPSFVNKPSMWVTDVAMIPAHSKLLVGVGERELHFYDIITFEFYCQIIGLDAVPLRIDLQQMEPDQCLIAYGDDQGCVSIIMLESMGDTLRAWKKVPKVNGIPTVTIQDVAHGAGSSFVKWKVHEDWVTELRYFHELRSVISSSNHASTALVRGCTTASTALDRLRQVISPGTSATPMQSNKEAGTTLRVVKKSPTMVAQRRQKTDQSVFYVYKGVKTFDFCRSSNIMASGGMDRIVRLWNPYVPQKATGLLRGHNSPIVFLSIAGEDGRLFSISADKCVKVWDLMEQNCLATVNPKLHKIKGDIVTCAYAHHCRAIAIATDQMCLLRITQKAKLAGEMSVTHSEAVTCCAHNPSFGHVITCSEGSVVKLWDFETGTFMFEFNKAHGDSAITSLTFDSSGRRLITSGRDGAVRMWNYNNGHCLRSLERENCTYEVSDCAYVQMNKNRYVIAVGWDHRINIFADETDFFHHVQRPYPHWPDDLRRGHTEDIVSVTFGSPNLLATVSYEGLIIVWNIISGHIISRIPYPTNRLPNLASKDPTFDDELTEDEDEGKQAVNKIAFIPARLARKDNAALVAGCSDGSVILWDPQSRVAHARWRATRRSAAVCAMAVSEDGSELFVGDHLGFVSIWFIEKYAIKPLRDLGGLTCPNVSIPPSRVTYWRCHVQPISWLHLVESHDVILTASPDFTSRVWTTDGLFIGSFGQSKPWDVHDPSTWQHPMVPPEVLLDPLSMPDHEILKDSNRYDSSEDSDEEGEDKSSKLSEKPRGKKERNSVRRTSKMFHGGGASDEWRRRLSRRLSRSALITDVNFFKRDETKMLDEVRQSMKSSSGKRLRHEKLVAQQRHLRTSHDTSSHAFQSLQYFELAEPPDEVDRPDPSAYIDDVFQSDRSEKVDA